MTAKTKNNILKKYAKIYQPTINTTNFKMKYIRLVSDIHLDFDIAEFNMSKLKNLPENKDTGEMGWLWNPPPLDGDIESTFVIAGDLWYERKFLTRESHRPEGRCFLDIISQNFMIEINS